MESSAAPAVVGAVSSRQRLTVLTVAVGGHAFKHLYHSAYFVLLPEIKAGLDLSNTQVGTLSTVRNLAGGLATIPAGMAADRFANRRAELLAVCLILAGIFTLMLGLAPTYAVALVAAGLLVGVITIWHPSAIASISRLFPQRHGFAIALHGSGSTAGEALGPIMFGFLLASFTWRQVLQGSVVPAVVIGGVIWLLLRSIPTGEGSVVSLGAQFRAIRGLLRNRRLLLILLLAGGFAGGSGTVFTFLPIYLREELKFSTVSLGLYLSLAQVAGIGSQPLMGYLSDRVGRKAVLVPSMVILGSALIGLYLVSPGWLFVVVVIVMGAFLPLVSILLAAAMDLVGSEVRGTVVSLVFGASVALSGLSPLAAGFLADAYGVKATFLWASGIVLATALLAVVTRWQPSEA